MPPLFSFGIAILIGALVGIEREKKKVDEREPTIGGLRTFMLIAMAGAIAAWLSVELATPWIFIAVGVVIGAVVVAGYILHVMGHPDAHGTTTEVAAIVVYLLGGLPVFGYQTIAVALAITTSALLAFKEPLHGAIERIGRDDLYAALKLLIATFVVLPVLPNRAIDPWGAVNPYRVWILVILISGLSLVGYVAARWLGEGRGMVVTGLVGGLVSSTAVTLSFAKTSREERLDPSKAQSLAAGLLLSWTVMFVRILVLVAVAYRALLEPVVAPMVAMGLASAVVAGVAYYQSSRTTEHNTTEGVPMKNPFSLLPAVNFALLFTGVLLLVKLAQAYLPTNGVLAVAALAGLTDVDAITLSMAEFSRTGGDIQLAATAIAVATITNTLVKCGLAAGLGARALGWRVIVATVLILGAGAIAIIAA